MESSCIDFLCLWENSSSFYEDLALILVPGLYAHYQCKSNPVCYRFWKSAKVIFAEV